MRAIDGSEVPDGFGNLSLIQDADNQDVFFVFVFFFSISVHLLKRQCHLLNMKFGNSKLKASNG